MGTLFQDIRYAVRTLAKSPAFAVAAILTLALGVGANTAIFSVVNAVLLRPLPYPQPERLVAGDWFMRGEYLILRDETRSFEQLALVQPDAGFNLADEQDAQRLIGAYVSTNLFTTLGVQPLVGRGFTAAEAQPGQSEVVVLSHGLWRQRFGGDPAIVDSEILVDSRPYRVAGVMPAGFAFPTHETQLWVPMTLDASNVVGLWGGGGGTLIGRLRPGVSVPRAQAEMRAFGPRLREANPLWTPDEDYRADTQVLTLQEQIVGDFRLRLLVVLGAVGFVLLIACANVANLLLTKAASRRREVAIRMALGAGRWRLVRQLLTESMVLAIAGGAAGLLLAYWGVSLLAGTLPAETPRAAEIAIDRAVLGFTLGVTVLTGLAFGIFPALRAVRADAGSWLRSGRAGGLGRTERRLSGALVAAEVALAVVLVIGAGLLIRSFQQLLRIDPGFHAENLVSARVTPPAVRYDDPAALRTFYAELSERVEALPGVTGAELANHLPLEGDWFGFAFEVEGVPYVTGGAPTVFDRRVSPGYLRTMGIPLLRGRPLSEADRQGAPRVALVNETMAREHWPGEDPIGKRFKPVWWRDEWITVVGVVGDVKQQGLAAETEAEIYRPFVQEPTAVMTLVVRGAADVRMLTANLRTALASVDPEVPLSEIRTMDQVRAASLAEPRFTMLLLGIFAFVALVLGAVGIYGVISYGVSQRIHEIGVRMALGARGHDVLRLMLRQGLALAAIGIAVGVLAALLASRLLASLLYGVGSTDLVTFAAVPLLLLCVALLASYLPARRAAQVDPMITLRAE